MNEQGECKLCSEQGSGAPTALSAGDDSCTACAHALSCLCLPITAAGGSAWFTRVVLPLALVLLVCNMDRICLSVAILPLAQEFGWPATVQVGQT